jgi:hypothetical protein
MTNRRNGMPAMSKPLLLCALTLACACRGEAPQPTTGSETHFLSWCSSAESCGAGLDCVCGVCTSVCTDASSCTGLAGTASCVVPSLRPVEQTCAGAPQAASCDVVCSASSDCAALGTAHRCDRGFCRKLADACLTGQFAGRDVVVLGDAFLGESHQVTAELQALARSAGALGADEQYRDYSTSTITPFGGSADLTTQYAAARNEGAVRVVIMDVGGPDALLACPEPPGPDCPALANAVAGADGLWSQMAQDGVEIVVDFFYPNPEDPSLRAKFDILRPQMQTTCEGNAVGCQWLDMRPTFEGRESDYLQPGWIVPTAAGSKAAAESLWSLMQQRCIAQCRQSKAALAIPDRSR